MKFVVTYSFSLCFVATFFASSLKNIEHSRLCPPKHEKTKGVKIPFSTQLILEFYLRFFSYSFQLYIASRFLFLYVLTRGLNTLISKNAQVPRDQKPLPATPLLTSFVLFADFENCSPDNGVSIGCMSTSLHTSDNKSAVIFLM